jgi:hypothetical protein
MTGGQTSLGLDAEQGSAVDLEPIAFKRGATAVSLPRWQADEASLQANREYIEFLAATHPNPAWK